MRDELLDVESIDERRRIYVRKLPRGRLMLTTQVSGKNYHLTFAESGAKALRDRLLEIYPLDSDEEEG